MKFLPVIKKIIAFCLGIYGIVLASRALTLTFGAGILGYAKTLSPEDIEFPYALIIFAILLMLALACINIFAAVGLWKSKSWQHIPLMVLGTISIVEAFIGNQPQEVVMASITWGIIYLGAGLFLKSGKY